MKRWLRRTLIAIAAVLVLAAAAGFVALKTSALMSDLRTETLGDETRGRELLHQSHEAHGGRDAWLAREWVELELEGRVPFPPARWGFGGVSERLTVKVRFDPREAGVTSLVIDDEEIGLQAGERDGLGLLADSVRHLWEFSFAMETANIIHALPSRDGHARVFASWGTAKPQMEVDQYILWMDDEQHLVRRFDSTGRAIAPFIIAHVRFEGFHDVEGFQLPNRVVVARDEEGLDLVHAWDLLSVRLGPSRTPQ